MGELNGFFIWLVLCTTSMVLLAIIGAKFNQKVANNTDPYWHRLTFRQKALISINRIFGSLIALVILFSPIYLEFPNLFGAPVVATVEDGRLVYHPWGLWDPPWKWNEQKVVNVIDQEHFNTLSVPARSMSGNVGILNLHITSGAPDLESYYLNEKDNAHSVVDRALIGHVIDIESELQNYNLELPNERKRICEVIKSRFSQDASHRAVRITGCRVYFNTQYPW